MIRLIRPVRSDPSKLTHPFEIHAAPLTDLRVVSAQRWLDEILGPRGSPVDPTGAAHRFRAAVDGVDFLFPSYECVAALPMLLLLRNRARCRTRLLFYSDTSATLCLWWALLRPLLRPGDRIIAPTESARRTIEFVCADVAPYIRVYGYPMPLPPKPAIASAARAPALTSMTRMTRTKLLHRQIEALAILKRRGLDARLSIVGNLRLGATAFKPYGLALGALTQRLGLSDHVSFPGLVTDETAKAALWAQSSVAVGLPLLFALRAPRWWYIGALFAAFPAALFARGAVDPGLWAIWSEYPAYVVQQVAMGVAALAMLAWVIVWRVRRIRSSRPAI